jgi:hypothetical protein
MRNEIMYSLIRSLIGRNEARIEIHDRVVVRMTRISDRPSTPILYWMPKNGIQSAAMTNWNNPPRCGPPAKPITSRSDATHVASAAVSASARALRAGAMATAIAPTSGRNVTIVRIGNVFTVRLALPG